MRLLITGATGKVGGHFLSALRREARFAECSVVALCHNRPLPPEAGAESVTGSIADRPTVARAMVGVTHVVHLAAVKESPDLAIDVAIKGMFNLMEEFRASPDARQFLLLGGDCAVGHAFQPYPGPVTEISPRKAYPGCYALTKVLEEVMLEQYQTQYDIDGCCLRAPWVMEKDDFRFAMAFGPEQFGGPPWDDFLPRDRIAALQGQDVVPLMLDRNGAPLRRNFIHVSDLVEAMLLALANPAARQHLFNIAMDEPVDYSKLAHHLSETREMQSLEIRTDMYSNWLDNSKAKHILNWRPTFDYKRMADDAWNYARQPNEPRKVWYPG